MPDFLDDFWKDYALRKPELICLQQDAALYQTMLAQVHGEFEYNESGIWAKNREATERKFSELITIAHQKRVHLFVVPEYSCPWLSLIKQAKLNVLPPMGAVWIIGCQSITPKQFQNEVDENPDLIWIYDRDLINDNINSKRFLDPVCILLKTKNIKNESVTVAIVQFKTYFFGGEGFEWERDNLIPGNTLYIIANEAGSTRLLTLICSDTLNPDLNIEESSNEFNNLPFLVIHIQLNQRPNAPNYKSYRNSIFAKSYQDKEVICVNWARHIKSEGKNWNDYGGSGIYMKSEKMDLSDARIDENHKLGLYYTRWADRRSHIYLFNFDEHVFIFNNTKPSQLHADPTQLRRSGPKMLELLAYDQDQWKETGQADDGLGQTCSKIEESDGSLECLKDGKSYVDTERLIQLTAGEILLSPDWYKIDHLLSATITDAEQNRRVLFSHEPSSEVIKERMLKLTKYSAVKHHIIKNSIPVKFPAFKIGLNTALRTSDKYLLNAHSETSSVCATIIYIGVAAPYQATDTRAKISSLFRDSHLGKNVMIFYNHAGVMKIDFDSAGSSPRAAENIEKSKLSYKRTDRL